MAICVRKANYQRYKTKYVTSRNYSRYDHSDMQNKLKNKDFSLVLNSVYRNKFTIIMCANNFWRINF